MKESRTEVLIANPQAPDRRETCKLLVDTGSAYTWVAQAFLQKLGIQPTMTRKVVTIQGKLLERPAAEVLMTLEGQTLHTLCLFGEPGELDVLGTITLEQFGLAVDPVQRRLVPARLFGA